MKIKISLLFLVAFAFFSGCSRESGIKPNPLLGKHPVVFLLREKPADVQAFIDSVLELPGDSVVIPDTVSATIKDTIWCVGYFSGTAKAVASYRWRVTGREDILNRKNNDLLGVAFDSIGVYQAKFVLRDNLNASDSAGAKQYIRIVNTKPLITFVSDTAYGKSTGPADFYFKASDTAGSISEVLLDMDKNGKWDSTIVWDGSDSVALSLAKGTKVDTAGNQTIIIGITDDDGNTTSDTLVLHFNRPPKITLTYPLDSGKVNIEERFAFYWEGTDSDNPDDMRYSIQVSTVTPFTSKHTRAFNLKDPTWQLIDEDGVRVDSTLKGNLFWRVMVTDGLDTTYSSSRKFFLGDPSVKYGKVNGVIRLQGNDRFDGVRITLINLKDGSRLITSTNPVYTYKGDFHFSFTPPGCYSLDARDTIGLYYSSVTLDSVCVQLGDSINLDTLTLLDKSKPRIVRNSILDTLYSTRSVTLSGIYADSGSLVDTSTFKAWLDNSAKAVSRPASGKWAVNLTDIPDGIHTFKIVVKDRAGNVSDTVRATFKVKAMQLSFTVKVNAAGTEGNAVVARTGGAPYDTLKFKLAVTNVNPAIDSVYFDLKGDGTVDKKLKAATNQTEFAYDTSAQNIPSSDSVRIVVAHVKTGGLTYLDTVSYRVRDRSKAAVIFKRPGKDSTVSKNDAIALLIQADASEGNTVNRYQWDIDGAAGYELDYNTNTAVTFPAATFGTFKLRVKITDTGANISTDSVVVTVLSQPPTVQSVVEKDTVKINGKVYASATATDVAPGTIAKYEWKCGSGSFEEVAGGSDSIVVSSTPGTYTCVVRATDNDDEVAYDTMTVLVKQDKPYVKVLTSEQDVTIRDPLQLKALMIDTLGKISQRAWSCAIPGSTQWKTTSKSDTVWTAPAVATANYYCIARVTDDDGQTAMDTTVYHVKLDPPYVKVFEDSLKKSINDVITLNAVVIDTLGSISKIQWACGNGGAGTWVTVGSPLYDTQLPSTGSTNYMCVIRAQDDDSTWMYDTTFIDIDQDAPVVNVKKEVISARVNEQFYVDCNASDKYGDVDFRWRCGTPGSLPAWPTEYYEECGDSKTAPSSGTNNYICVVEAVDEDGQKSYDTTKVLVVKPPEAIINPVNILSIWSGDVDIPEESRYWNYAINGTSSIIGTPLGNINTKDFWWQFSHYSPSAWYQGLPDGTLDQNYEGFDQALLRPTTPMTIEVRLDFRDSILPTGETDPTFIYDFYVRHLDYDSIDVTFKRFWVNQGPDTVVQLANRAVNIAADNVGPYVSFRSSADGYGWVKKWNGSTWAVIGGGDIGNGSIVDTLRMVRDTANGDIYVAYRNSAGNITVKKSSAGTGNWAVVGGDDITVNGSNTKKIAIAAKSGKVAVAWVGGDNIMHTMVSVSSVNSGVWGWAGTAAAVGSPRGTNTDSDIGLAFNKGAIDTLAVLSLGTDYSTRLYLYRNANLGTGAGSTTVAGSTDAVSIAYAANGRIFVAYNNRADYGPHVVRMASNALGTKTHMAGYGTSSNVSIHRVGRATSISIGADNNPYLAYDDDFFAPQVHVWKHDGTSWHLHGENMLPHFKELFYDTKHYYLKASSPSIAIAPNGSAYIGMIAIDGRGGSAVNNGPIVMKYVP